MSKVPESTMIEVRRRSGNWCEVDGCVRLDWRGLQFAHIVHRGIGGRNGEAEKMIHDPRNVAHSCAYHHGVIDGRQWDPQLKAEILEALKIKLCWRSWADECHAKGIHIGSVE